MKRTSTALTTTNKTAKTTRRRKYISKIPTSVNVGKQPFPKQYRGSFRYCDQISVNLVAGIGNYIYSANGLFDPDFTGTGHQPLYYDQIMAIYDHYTVLKSKIKVTPMIGVAANFLGVVYIDDDTSTRANAITMLESPGGTYIAGNFSGGTPVRPLVLHWDAKKTFGGDPQSQDSLQGTVSANPTEQSFFVIGMEDVSPGTTVTVQLVVELEFDAVFDELKTIAQS